MTGTTTETTLWIIGFLGLGVVIGWWLIFRTEGVYLGSRVVIWLYDLYARRYDSIKDFNPEWEAMYLAQPLQKALSQVPTPLILDIATGTGRLPLALMRQSDFHGHIIGLDYSRKMLAVAAEKLDTQRDRVDLIYQSATALPFDDETFDTITCLEALEFMPVPDAVLAEMVRVARPGALILITNRKGIDAHLMPGKTQTRQAIIAKLRDRFGLEDVTANIWQVDYDQVWAFKAGLLEAAPDHRLTAILRCPLCGKRTLKAEKNPSDVLHCVNCNASIGIGADGVIDYAHSDTIAQPPFDC